MTGAFAAALAPPPLAAADITWIGGTGNWSVAANWSPATVPGAADNVFIDGGSVTNSVVSLNTFGNINNLTISLGDTLGINDGQTLSINGNVTNAGTLGLNSTGTTTDLRIGAGTTFSGAGTVTLSNNANNRIWGLSSTNVLTNAAGHTIQGAGQLGVGLMGLNNAGLIDANQSNALVVHLNNAAGVTRSNSGTMQASSGGTLTIFSTNLANTGGTIQALAGSAVNLTGGTRITGGTLTTAGDGVVLLGGSATLDTLANSGLVQLNNGQTGFLAGTITNTGTIALASTGATTDLRIGGQRITLTGAGAVTLSNNANNRIWGLSSTNVLTNAADHTIQGAGQLGVGLMGLNNAGLIDANQSNALVVHLNNAAGVTRSNSGTMQASSGGTLTIFSTNLANTGGTIQALAGSAVNLTGGTRITGGTLTTAGDGVVLLGGSATLDTLANSGLVQLNNGQTGFLAGTITNTGTIALASTGATTDLRIDGNVTLTGAGTVTLSNNANNRIWGLAVTNVLTNAAGHTIQGAGQLVVGLMGLNNAGLIDANQSNALVVHLNNAAGVTRSNSGTMQASSGGTLTIFSTNLANTGGTIQALAGSAVNLTGGTRITGGTLTTAGDGVVLLGGSATLDTLANSGRVRLDNSQTGFLAGTITNTGTIALASTGASTDLRIDGNVTLTGAGTVTLSNNANNRIWGLSSTNVLTNAAGHTIRGSGQLGVNLMGLNNAGLIDANQAVALTIDPHDAITVQNQATGILRGSGTGGLTLTGGTFDNQGTVEALNGSNVTYATSAVTANNLAGVLTGGIWRAESSGAGATVTLRGSNITTNAADVYLKGAGSVIQVGTTSIDGTLHTNNGALRLQDGRVFNATANSGNFTNNGLLEVTDATFTSNTLASNGNIVSFGNSTVTTGAGNRVTGTGAISSSFGTLTITRGVDMGAGSSMTSNAGATIDLSGATQASRIATLNNNGSLNLGAQNLVVSKDYTNANFGTGNAFDRRANVSGAGQLIGENAAQTITGAVTAAGANTWTLNLGNVRGGTSATVNYQVANNGTGADIRGAVQTAANGGNITDARLSGSGVTAGNFGPIAAGGNSGNLTVTFNATAGGSLSGQSIAVVSNFDNVATQIINLSGTASALAVGNATPNTDPVNLGNFRVGGAAPLQNFAVQNQTAGAGAERLGIGGVVTSGNFSASNNLGAGFVNPGASQAGAVTAQVSGGVAGVNNGSVTVQYTTNGQLIDSSFTTINANAQTINLQATGYVAAAGALLTPSHNFATIQVGQTSAPFLLSIQNTATGPAGYVEDLNARFGTPGTSSFGTINTSGQIVSLAAGTTNSTSMSVSVTGTAAGVITDLPVPINFFTAGTVGGSAIAGLSEAPVGSANFLASANIILSVVDQAKPVTNGVLSPAAVTVNLGNVRVGGLLEQALSVLNQATGNPQAALNASIASNGGPVTASGSFNLLPPGSTNGTDLRVGVITASAGAKSGTATISFVSDASNIGNCAPNCQLNLPSQTVNVSGNVFLQAQPDVPAVVNLGNVRLGSATQAITIGNTDVAGSFQEELNASIGTTTGQATASGGPIVNLAAGSTSNAISVGLNGIVAGTGNSGTVQINLASNGTVSGLANLDLPSQTVTVNATGYRLANPTINNSPITISARVGDAVAANRGVSITNSSPDIYTEGLKVSVNSASGNAQGAGSIANLAAQGTDSGSILVGLASTATAGLTSGTVSLNMISTGAGTTGAADEFLGTQNVTVNGKIYTPAVAQLVTTAVNFGIRRVGDAVAPVAVTVKNNAAATDLNDTLAASMGTVSGPFTGSGSVSGLGAGDSGSGTLIVGLATGNAGIFNGTASIGFASQNPDMADLGLGSLTVALSGQVNNRANPVFGKTGGAGSFGCSALVCTLDFGNLFVGSGPTSGILALTNSALAPADDLIGAFDIAGLGDFMGAGFGPVNLVAGASLGGLTLSFDALTEGLFTGSFVFSGASRNAFQSDLALADIKIFLRANVIPTGTVPEPGTISIVLLGAGLAFAARRRQAQRH